MFEGRKIKKLLDNYYAADSEQQQTELARELAGHGRPVVRQVIDGLGARKFNPHMSQFLLEKICDDSNLEDIVPLLGGSHYEIRIIAREMILSRWRKAALPLLLQDLNHPDPHVRDGAADILSVLKDASTVPELVSMFNSADVELKKRILKIVSKTGGQAARSLLISALHDDSPVVCMAAVKGLGRGKDPECVEPLVEKLADDDIKMKKLVIKALNAVGDSRAARPVLQYIKDDDMLVRQEAIECTINIAEADIVPDIIDLMKDGDVNVRRCSVEVLNNLKDPRTVQVLIKAIKDSDWWVRQIATDSLTGLKGDVVVKSFIAMASDEDENIRRCAVEFFNEVQVAASIDALIDLLKDHDWWVREKAATAIGKLKDKRAIQPLAEMINDDEAKGAVPGALAEIGGDEVIEPLKHFLDDESKLVRMESIKAFAKLKATDAVDDIEDRLTDPDEDVRLLAVKALKVITGKSYKPGNGKVGSNSVHRAQAAPGGILTEAIMVIDLCNSTDTATRYGDHFVMTLMKTLDEIIAPIAKKEKVQFLKGTGDGFLITFPGVKNAIQLAFKVFNKVKKYNDRSEPNGRMNLRMGINLGETRIDKKGDRIGVAINMAFRVEGVKPEKLISMDDGMTKEEMPTENRVLITENVEKEIHGLKEINTSLVGFFELKGITGLHKVYHLTTAK